MVWPSACGPRARRPNSPSSSRNWNWRWHAPINQLPRPATAALKPLAAIDIPDQQVRFGSVFIQPVNDRSPVPVAFSHRHLRSIKPRQVNALPLSLSNSEQPTRPVSPSPRLYRITYGPIIRCRTHRYQKVTKVGYREMD